MKISAVAFALFVLSGMLLSETAGEEHEGDSYEAARGQHSEEYTLQERSAETPHVRVRRWFGCPIGYICNDHCKSIQRRAGYCDGPLNMRCVCTT